MSGSVPCFVCGFAGSTSPIGAYYLCQTHMLVYNHKTKGRDECYIEPILQMREEYDQSREEGNYGRGPE